MEQIRKTVEEIIENPEICPLPLDVIPNRMGINLVSVEEISWEKWNDGQLTHLTIHFRPVVKKNNEE